MTRRIVVGFVAAVLGAGLVGWTEGALGGALGASPLATASCSPIQNPDGDLLITSDLPEHGPGRPQVAQMEKAISFVLAENGWRAGRYTLAYQACDDSSAPSGKWDAARCSANASAYAAHPSVVGVIGPLNSGCAQSEIPVLNRAPNGPLAMVSPATVSVGLTHSGPGTTLGEPNRYYPTGRRNYARVLAADDYQAAADATLARLLGLTKVFVLNDRTAYGSGIAKSFRDAAAKLGIEVAGFAWWDPSASSYGGLAARIARSGAQAVFLGGLVCNNGGKLIRDLRAGAPAARLMASDGFTPFSSAYRLSYGAAAGMTVSVAGLPNQDLPAAGKAFVRAFSARLDGSVPDPYAVYAAQAAQVLVAAVAASNGTRAGISSQLFRVKLPGSILGDVSFDANGDVTVNPVTIYQINGTKPYAAMYRVIYPSAGLVGGS